LRYRCFSQSDAAFIIDKQATEIDINYFDLFSHHFGLFRHSDLEEIPVGFLRIVMLSETPSASWIRNIARRYCLLQEIEKKSDARLPCFALYPQKQIMMEFFNHLNHEETIGEASRFFVCEEERFLLPIKQIITGEFSIGLLYLQHAFLGCFSTHAEAYNMFGFARFQGSAPFEIKTPGKTRIGEILYLNRSMIPPKFLALSDKIQRQYLDAGELCYFGKSEKESSLNL